MPKLAQVGQFDYDSKWFLLCVFAEFLCGSLIINWPGVAYFSAASCHQIWKRDKEIGYLPLFGLFLTHISLALSRL